MSRWSAVIALAALAGCGGDNPGGVQPSPTPTPGLPGVTVGQGTGNATIALVTAAPAPGSTLSGCGPDGAGCASRIRMSFRLTPTVAGTALWCTGFLHASNNLACLQGRTGPLTLQAGVAQTVEVLFDTAAPSGCRTPADITHLAFVVDGAGISARQEWGLRYTLAP